jgi:hypothetical protein
MWKLAIRHAILGKPDKETSVISPSTRIARCARPWISE